MSGVRSFVKFSHAGHDPKNVRKYDENDEEEWRFVRFFALFASFCALGFTSVAVCNKHWISGPGFSFGLWDVYCNATTDRTPAEEQICSDKKTPWQIVVIGLLLFAVLIGLLATVLCTFGVCVDSVNAKMYYFHSAGEIFLVCMLCSTASLIVYSVAVEVERRQAVQSSSSSSSFGAGYFLAWLADAFYGAAAVGMSVDDVVYECRRSNVARRRSRQQQQQQRVHHARTPLTPAAASAAAASAAAAAEKV